MRKNDETKKASAIIRERKEVLNILADILDNMEREQLYVLQSYECIRKYEVTNDETGETEIKRDYDYVHKDYDDLSESEKARYNAYTTVINMISKLA